LVWVCSGSPLIGCSSESLVSAGEQTQGVVVTALGGSGFAVRTAAGSCANGAQRAGGATVAQCGADLLPASADGRQVLILLTDGRVAKQEEILAGAYGVVGASIPMIGGTSGAVPGLPYQLHARDVLHEHAVGALVSSDGPLGFGLRHGWRRTGEPMMVTQSVGGDVQTLDDRPALDAYLERYGAPAEAFRDPAEFEAFAQCRPIGIRRRHGMEVRSVSSASGMAKGWLRPSGEVPEGALVWPMEGDAQTALDAAGHACRDAVEALGGAPPLGLLAFDCVSRRHLLGGDGIRQEARLMLDQSAGAPITGLYTWGEILRVRGLNGFHNQTLAVLAVG
jgi:hypothetical protein